jgi:hypothetical protein
MIYFISIGKFYWRGHVTTLAEKPGAFWFLIVMNSALFTGLFDLVDFWSEFKRSP